MYKKILYLVLAFSPICGLALEIKQDTLDQKPSVYLIGSIHNMHFNQDKNYSVNDLLSQIQQLKPDLICGEITPEAFEKPMEGYFPPEAAFLAEMASEYNYRFEPVDWRLDYATQDIASKRFPASVKEKRSLLLKKVQVEFSESDKPSFYDDIHKEAILNYLDSLYENIIGTDALAEIASGSWNERNRRIIENGLAAASNARVIVFVFGLDHIPGLKRHLMLAGIEAKIPKRLFTPGNNFEVSDAVLERWKRNLENLKLIRDKKAPTTYDNYQKVVESNRIQDLDEAIKVSTK
jgi:hypothetical protein